uniref:Death domain-containing protein n=1 Tax=Amphimedon queenslandica TaxID=400682 RepID=A0A1X7T727_AMPQE
MKSNPQSPSLDIIKYALGAYNNAFKPQLAQCQDIHDILRLVCDKSSLDDISMLEYFVNGFNIEEAKAVIKEYEETIEGLKNKLRQFLEKELLKTSLLLKYVTIVVDKDTSYSVLNDVQRLSSAVLSHYVRINVIRGDGSSGEARKQELFPDTFDDPTVQSKDSTFAMIELPAGTTEFESHLYQKEEDKKDKDQVMMLQEKVKSIQKQLEEEKELREEEKEFHQEKVKSIQKQLEEEKELREEEKEFHEQVAKDYEELKSEIVLTHKQLEELQKKLKEEIKTSSSLMEQKEAALREKEELQIKIDDLQQELELQQVKDHKEVSVQCEYTITQSELQSEIEKIKNERETFQKQRKALILENERLMTLLKDQNVPVQQKEETEILQETETVHTCTYISKDSISQSSVILELVEDDWYHIGQCLEVKESVLTEIKEMTPVDSRLTHVLEICCNEKDRTITELEDSLKRMDRDDILEGLHELPTGQYTMNNDEEYDINVKDSNVFEIQIETENKEIQTTQTTHDKEIQFNYLVLSQDNLEGLSESQIAGKKLFLVQGDKPQLMNWEEYGLRISVAEDSLSASETVEVSVLALVGGHFKFPDNTRLVSAVYAISTSPLVKSLRIEMQHCIDLSDPSLSKYLKFAVAPVHTASLPYQFSLIEGGEFPAYQRYGWIERSKFCQLAIVGEEEEENGRGRNEERNGEEDGDSGGEGGHGKGQTTGGEGQGAGREEGGAGGGVVAEHQQQKEDKRQVESQLSQEKNNHEKKEHDDEGRVGKKLLQEKKGEQYIEE